ncbi:hypothetical protein LTR86_004112 [Recurvomyces mirabilis]|nr:hypothetical protein LTR86_004112 [Recurvomyces mirabilis]
MQAWVTETPGGGDEQSKSLYNETGARRRRAHPKSRNGCQHCKQRRVKCDEVRPACGQCIERKWKCEYPPPERRAHLSPPPRNDSSEALAIPKTEPETPPTSISDSGSPAAESRYAIHTGVIAYLERTSIPRRKLEPDGPQVRLAVELVDHFLDTTELWVGSPVSQTIIQRHAFPMALHASYLLHAVLGCAASHLQFLHPGETKYATAALHHYTRSLQAYSSQLVHDIEHGDGQAMMAASGLLAKLTFINTVAMNADEPLSSRTSPVCWIRSMQGVKVILSTPKLKTQLQTGFLLPILQRYKTPPPMDINMRVDVQDPDSPTTVVDGSLGKDRMQTDVRLLVSDRGRKSARVVEVPGEMLWV